jgi:DNA-binding XRE family transcriptional regulator
VGDSTSTTGSEQGAAYPKDPVANNPFPADDPRHAIWKNATRDALIELHHLKHQTLSRPTVADRPLEEVLLENLRDPSFTAQARKREQEKIIGFVFHRFQIWARRAIAVVRTDQDAQDYERWLRLYRESEMNLWAEKGPECFDIPWFSAKLGRELSRAVEHWLAQGLQKTVANVDADSDGYSWVPVKHDFQADREVSQDCPTFLRPAKAARLKALGILRGHATLTIRSCKPQTSAEVVECSWPLLAQYAREVFDAMAEAKLAGGRPKSYSRWLREKCLPAVVDDVCRPIVGQFVITIRYVAEMINDIGSPAEDVQTRRVLWRTYADEVIPGDSTRNLGTRLRLMLQEERVPHWESKAVTVAAGGTDVPASLQRIDSGGEVKVPHRGPRIPRRVARLKKGKARGGRPPSLVPINGPTIKQTRQLAKLTQARLAQICNCTDETIGQAEKGLVDGALLTKILAAFRERGLTLAPEQVKLAGTDPENTEKT